MQPQSLPAAEQHVMRFEPVIRQGELADAKNLAALSIQVWLHTYATEGISSAIARYVLSEFTPENFSALLTNPTVSVLVSEVHTSLVGYALLNFGAPCPVGSTATVELATLYVQEHFAKKGVGSAVLARAESLSRQRASEPLWLSVNAKNQRAIAFYAKHGYSQVGVTQFLLGGESHENHVLVGKCA